METKQLKAAEDKAKTSFTLSATTPLPVDKSRTIIVSNEGFPVPARVS